MAEALIITDGLTFILPIAETSARVESTLLVRRSRFRSAVQRPPAMEAPARLTTASAPTAAPPSSPVAGSQATSKAPAAPPSVRVSRRTSRQTVCPSLARAGTSALPTMPVAPATRIFIPGVYGGERALGSGQREFR